MAPRRRKFFAADWSPVPDGGVPKYLLTISAEITGIHDDVLIGKRMPSEFCIATRMS
jgi:hypothetical protein